jgi:hypothetical protein
VDQVIEYLPSKLSSILCPPKEKEKKTWLFIHSLGATKAHSKDPSSP